MGSYGRFFDGDDLLKLLRTRIQSAGGQSEFARKTGINRTHLNKVLNSARPPSSRILGALNLRIVYAPVGRRSSALARATDD